MAKHTVYIPDHVEPILTALLAIQKAEHPGTTPRCSHVISDALMAQAVNTSITHFQKNGISPKIKAKLEALSDAMEQITNA